MPVYSAREDRDALVVWTLVVGRRRFPARPVSGAVVADAITALESAASLAEQHAVARALWRQAFPWRLSYRWRGDPVAFLEQLPHDEWWATLRSFFDFALRSRTDPGARPTTSSTSRSSQGDEAATGAAPAFASS